MKENKIRIQKIISDSGFCSRRKAEALIEDGSVKLNGHPVKLGDKADPREDLITVNGERIETNSATLRYIKLYKPRGYVTSMEDNHETKLVTALLKGVDERVYPVGRLDKNSEGLLILTNDGAFANDIMHPKKHVQKVYRVTIPSAVTEEHLNKLMSGVEIEEGVTTQPCTVTPIIESPERTVLEFIIREGKNRQIRKMCTAVGLNVSRLRRTNVGGVKLGMLKPGEYADLSKEELRILRASIGGSGELTASKPKKASPKKPAPAARRGMGKEFENATRLGDKRGFKTGSNRNAGNKKK